MTDCPFCGESMTVQSGLPEWLNPRGMIRDHPMPIIGGYAARKLDEAANRIVQHVTTRICSKCGYVAFFTKNP